MSDIAVTIITTAAVIMALALGYTVARLRDLRAQVDVQRHALDALAAPSETEQPAKKRRHLYVVRALLPLLSMASSAGWLRRHWRTVAAAATAVGAACVIAVTVLGRSAPTPGRSLTGPHPSPPQTTRSASNAPPSAPATTPERHSPSPVPAVPLAPVRTRRTPPAPESSGSAQVASPPPTPTARPSRTPSRRASPSPSRTCPAGLSLRLGPIGVWICV